MANEIRLRVNNISGAINDNPLTNVATTINSPSFADLPVVDTTNHLIITLDPLEIHGAAETVRVVAHTAAATSVTVIRGQEGSAARQHPLATVWFHGPVGSDWNYTQRAALSTNRPATPFAGELIFETDTDKFVARNAANTAWVDAVPLGAFQTYTPTNAGITLGNGVQVARFTRIGRIIYVEYELTFGTTTAFTADVSIGLPVTALGGATFVGAATYLDTNVRHLGTIRRNGTALGQLNHAQPANNLGVVNPNFPFVWATGDVVWAAWHYEAAS